MDMDGWQGSRADFSDGSMLTWMPASIYHFLQFDPVLANQIWLGSCLVI